AKVSAARSAFFAAAGSAPNTARHGVRRRPSRVPRRATAQDRCRWSADASRRHGGTSPLTLSDLLSAWSLVRVRPGEPIPDKGLAAIGLTPVFSNAVGYRVSKTVRLIEDRSTQDPELLALDQFEVDFGTEARLSRRMDETVRIDSDVLGEAVFLH